MEKNLAKCKCKECSKFQVHPLHLFDYPPYPRCVDCGGKLDRSRRWGDFEGVQKAPPRFMTCDALDGAMAGTSEGNKIVFALNRDQFPLPCDPNRKFSVSRWDLLK